VLLDDEAVPQNPFDSRNNRAVSAFDVRHRVSLSHTYDLPLSKRSNRVLKWTLGGWQFSGIYVVQSGLPITFRAGSKRGLTDALLLGTAAGSQRPDFVAPLNLQFTPNPGGTPANKVSNSGLAQPLVGHFGSMSRNAARINGLNNFDWALSKKFPITDRVQVQFQTQVYNVFNHTSFAVIGTGARTLSSPNVFGYYDGTQSEARNIQLNLRLIW
jgi:hypothetical protein